MFRFKPTGVCSKEIEFDIADGVIVFCDFRGGCDGNLTGIARLVTGMKVDDVIAKLKGIPCQGDTSCPDQLAIALEQYRMQR